MDRVEEEEFDKIQVPDDGPSKLPLMSPEDMKALETSFDHPIEKQKELAAKVKPCRARKITVRFIWPPMKKMVLYA